MRCCLISFFIFSIVEYHESWALSPESSSFEQAGEQAEGVFGQMLPDIINQVFTKPVDKPKEERATGGNSNKLSECLKENHSNADIVWKGDKKYAQSNFQWNLRKLKYPRAYIFVNSTEDVQIALKCLIKHKLKFRTKCGGHSTEKYSLTDSYVIDLSHLNEVDYNSGTSAAIVGGGTNAFTAIKRLWATGKKGLPYGDCPTVGLGGFTLGGGFGQVSRNFGMMCDNVVEMEVVTANQKVLQVNEKKNADLFWALRGGGGGNFGIVTKFHYKPFDASANALMSMIVYPIDSFHVVFENWQRWAQTNPTKSIDSVFYYQVFEPEKIHLKFMIYHTDINKSFKALRGIKAYFPEVDNPKNLKNEQFLDITYPGSDGSQPPTSYEKHKSLFISEPLTPADIDKFNRRLVEHSYVSFLMKFLGGAIAAKSSSTENAFCHRSSLFEMTYGFTIFTNDEINRQMAITIGKQLEPKLRQFARSIEFISNHEAYINAIDEDEQFPFSKYYCNNHYFSKLRRVKRKYDPKGVFEFEGSIPN